MLNNRVRAQIARPQQTAVEQAEVVVADHPYKALWIGRGASAEGPVGRLRAHAYSIVPASPCPVLSV